MKRALFLFWMLSLFNIAFAQHNEHALTKAKIAHDASHRVGRLVDMGRVDEMFLRNMTALEVRIIPHTNHADPAFGVIAYAGNGDAQIDLKFDMNGKFLPPHQVRGQSSPQETPWAGNSSELLEAALHWAMTATSPTTDFAPYNAQLAKAQLVRQQNSDGTVGPKVLLTSEASSGVLEISLTASGEVTGYTISQ